MTGSNLAFQGGNSSGCGVPTSASAVSITVTATRTIGAGYAAAIPAAGAWSGNSTVNWVSDGDDVAASTNVGIADGTTGYGSISMLVDGDRSIGTATDLLVDITGYFVTAGSTIQTSSSQNCALSAAATSTCNPSCPAGTTKPISVGWDGLPPGATITSSQPSISSGPGWTIQVNNPGAAVSTFRTSVLCSP